MIKTRKDGTKYYYYYKKKVGRHKKTGKKHTPRKRGREWQETWDFKIVKCTFNKQDEFIGIFHDLTEVEAVKKILETENSNVLLPVKYVNTSRLGSDRYNTTEYVSEYLILKRIRNDGDKLPTKLRDEYGRLVEHTTNSEVWKIYDKFPCLKEEKFWVYGYNPQSDRKTFQWIYDNLIMEEFLEDNSIVIQCYVYKNKVILTYDGNRLRFVICKNGSDAIRLYNELNTHTQKHKVHHIYFMGQLTSYSQRGKMIINQIADLTGWNLNKIRQKAT